MKSLLLATAIFSCLLFTACSRHEPSVESLQHFQIMPAADIYKNLEQRLIRERYRQLDSLFDKLHRNEGLNGVVLYAEKGRVVYEKAFGYEFPQRKKNPLHLGSRFELASVSKMFTATAVLMLVEQRLVDLDADIRQYISEWPYAGVTVRHLLTHRSGLPRYEYVADEFWADKEKPLTNEKMIRLFVNHQPQPYFAPGKGFNYCNTNYALLASIVERVSGLPFDVFMRERIFNPARMYNAGIYRMPSEEQLMEFRTDVVPGYDVRRRGLERVPEDYLNGVMGDKIMHATARDLYQFHMALENGLLLRDETLREAYSPGSPRRRFSDNYGFGWRIKASADSTVYHYGWWKGFRSYFLRDLKNDRVMIVLTNKSAGPGSAHYWRVLEDMRVVFPDASPNHSQYWREWRE
ncbi:MAG TPA: serine hydrolase domain-containing protein [Bacteroidales bacterium]|nr:serine hydrolase domain-containing protein [Bacteroidales bacterium]